MLEERQECDVRRECWQTVVALVVVTVGVCGASIVAAIMGIKEIVIIEGVVGAILGVCGGAALGFWTESPRIPYPINWVLVTLLNAAASFIIAYWRGSSRVEVIGLVTCVFIVIIIGLLGRYGLSKEVWKVMCWGFGAAILAVSLLCFLIWGVIQILSPSLAY